MDIKLCVKCDNPARTKGMCPRHYSQELNGSKEQEPYGSKPSRECAVSHCSREARGYNEGSLCDTHYQIKWRGIDPEERVLRKDPARYDKRCWTPECPKRAATKGLCAYHYQRARQGKLEVPDSLGITLNKPCTFDGCGRISSTRGLCHSHYTQWQEGRELKELREWGKYTKGKHACSIKKCRKPATTSGLCGNHITLKNRYGLTAERMVAIWENPVCENEGCGSTKRLHMDHDHATGEYRGLLCNGCNSSLGFLKEDPDRIIKLAEYIKRFQ